MGGAANLTTQNPRPDADLARHGTSRRISAVTLRHMECMPHTARRSTERPAHDSMSSWEPTVAWRWLADVRPYLVDVNACGLPRRSGTKHPQNADLWDRPAISRYECGVEAAYRWAVAVIQRHDSDGQASIVLRLGRRGLLLRPHICDEMHQLIASFELYHERAVAGDALPMWTRPSRFRAVPADWPVTPITRARPL